MPKLNTTIDKIENKDNKIKSATTPSENWTDEQYPSAKTLYNMLNLMQTYLTNAVDTSMNTTVHPIGSILITSTKINPGETLGGEWELIDKSFKDRYITLTAANWTNLNSTINEYSNVALTDHTISIRLNLTTTVDLADETVDIGVLDLSACGISNLTHAVFYDAIISDKGNCTMSYRMDQEGKVTIPEVLNVNGTHFMPSGSDFYIHLVQPIRHTYMLDDFCDKFYWKRIA